MGSHWVVEGPLMMAQSPTLAFCHPHLLPPVVWSSLLCCLSTATAFPFPISGHHHFTLAAPWESATLQSLRRPAGVSIPAQRISRLRRVEQGSVVSSCHL